MFCACTRPRYQVSVCRTIGPLVFDFLRYFDFTCRTKEKHVWISSEKQVVQSCNEINAMAEIPDGMVPQRTTNISCFDFSTI